MKEKQTKPLTKKQQRKRRKKALLIAGTGILMVLGTIGISLSGKTAPPERISYTQYQEYLENHEIDVIRYSKLEEYMTIYLGTDATADMTDKQKEEFDYPEENVMKVMFPNNEDFRKEVLEQGVVLVNAGELKGFEKFIEQYAGLIVYCVFIAVLLIAVRKSNPANASGAARIIESDEIDVSFDDVIGHEKIKEDLKLIAKQLKDGKDTKYISHGILFEGAAGTGKTMLAKAVAKDAGLNFISVNSSGLVEMFVGLGARRVRDVFKKARKNAPCVLFFDELDGVGSKRGNQRSHRENDQTINELLAQMDGFETTKGIFVIAATNRGDDLDDALVRSGRFDRRIKFDVPHKWETRKELLDKNLEGCKVSDNVNTEIIAKQILGFSGADIAALVREANLVSYRDNNGAISQGNIEEAIDKIVFRGNRSDDEIKPEEIKRTAYHEAGHAVGKLVAGKQISRISIRSMTSETDGAVFSSDENKRNITKCELENLIISVYAGRAAEEVFFGRDNVSDGATSDITKATEYITRYVAKIGFDDSFAPVDVAVLQKNGIVSEENLMKRISEVSNMLYRKTVHLIEEHKPEIQILAEKLIEVKSMDGNEVNELLKGKLV